MKIRAYFFGKAAKKGIVQQQNIDKFTHKMILYVRTYNFVKFQFYEVVWIYGTNNVYNEGN